MIVLARRDARQSIASAMVEVPRYASLPVYDGGGARHAWDFFGRGDDLGRIGLITAEMRIAAMTEVRRGAFFNLSLPLDLPNPPWGQSRASVEHTIFQASRNVQDDRLDSFYLQASSQWDGLRHIRAASSGFFGGITDASATDGDRLGIDHWVRHGMIGRGVVADVAGYLADMGRPLDSRMGTAISVDDLMKTLVEAGVELQLGDFLMLHTGYMAAYLDADPSHRRDWSARRDCPGLYAGEEMAQFLWDSGVVAIVTDNPAVEVVPGNPNAGSLHRRLVPLLGFALGELFALAELVNDCRRDKRYTCLFAAAPLNLRGAVGSPANAFALK